MREKEDRQRDADHHAMHRPALRYTQVDHRQLFDVTPHSAGSPRGLPAAWPVCSGMCHNVQVWGGHMGEKEKCNSLNIMKRDGTGGWRGGACWKWPALPLGAMLRSQPSYH